MKIKLNNRDEEFNADKLTISQILEIKNFTFKMLVVKVNSQIIKKNDYANTVVRDGDDVLIIHLISGG